MPKCAGVSVIAYSLFRFRLPYLTNSNFITSFSP
jgi:hypothetical protein